jgi:general secretion pathway protein M
MSGEWLPRHGSALSKLAAVLLLVTVIGGVAAVFAAPTLWLHKRYDQFLDDYADRLQRYRRVAATRTNVDSAIENVRRADGRKYYLKSPSDNLAAAELQTLATQTVERFSGRVLSSQIQATLNDEKSRERKVKISIQLSAATTPMQLILHTIETHTPYLFIETASFSSRYGRGYRPEPGVQPEIDANLVIVAYLPPHGAPP